MHILVVGGNGFVGSHIVDSLLAARVKVSVLDCRGERYRSPLSTVQYFAGNFGDPKAVGHALAQTPDVVIHLANSMLPEELNGICENECRDLTDSVALFHACVLQGVKKIVFMSSGGTVYGIPKHLPVQEDAPTNPICSYGIVKLTIEKYLLAFAQTYGIDAVIVRPANPFGERQAPDGNQGVIPIFMRKIRNNETISLWGDGQIIRDFIYVTDVARFCVLSALHECSGVFNLGSGKGISLSDLVMLLSKHLGIRADVCVQPARRLDVPAIVLNCTRAKERLNWEPQISLNEGLSKLSSWLQVLERMSSAAYAPLTSLAPLEREQ
jgi:UDP-glucose 4-epimerase